MKKKYISLWLLLFVLFAQYSKATNIYDPMSRIDFWRRHFQEISATDSALVTKAEGIFSRVLRIAGHRHGVQPKLLVVDTGKRAIQLPVAIPGGWIILSKQMLDKLSTDRTTFDSRLAFVLGHEIAHQLEDDFWNIKFFNAVQSFKNEEKVLPKEIDSVSRIARESNKIIAKELKADEQGIIYAAMAGYDISQLFSTNKSSDDFFKEWMSYLYPEIDKSNIQPQSHPTLQERETAIKARLHQVHSYAQLFQLGTWFYYSGQFDKAAEIFREFVGYFPEKSAHLNLAASYHQLFIQHSPQSDAKEHLPFKLSFTIDPHSNAKFGIFRSGPSTGQRHHYYRDQAILYYELALSQDPQYISAINNLACIYVLDNKPYKTISYLQDALQLENNNPQLHNNIAIAFYKIGNIKMAEQHFEKSLQLDNDFANGLLNSGLLAIRSNNNKLAKQMWDQYFKTDDMDDWSVALIQHYKLEYPFKINKVVTSEQETLSKVVVGTYINELPQEWQSPRSKSFLIGQDKHQFIEYDNGVFAVSDEDELRLLIASAQFSGNTRLNIKIGDSKQSVLTNYGLPSHSISSPQGEALMYVNEGITFMTANNQVTSWVLYWN